MSLIRKLVSDQMSVKLGNLTKGMGGQQACLGQFFIRVPPPPQHSKLHPVSQQFTFNKRPVAVWLTDVLFVM